MLLATKAQSDDRRLGAMNDEVLGKRQSTVRACLNHAFSSSPGLKLATQAEEAMCSTIKEQLAKCMCLGAYVVAAH